LGVLHVVSIPSVSVPAAAVISSTNTLPVGSVVASSYVIPGDDAQVAYEGINAVMPPSASAPPMNPAFYARSSVQIKSVHGRF